MKIKLTSLLALSVLSILVLSSLVSADVNFTSDMPALSIYSSSFNVNTDTNSDISFSPLTLTDGNGKEITFEVTAGQGTVSHTITYTIDAGFQFDTSNYKILDSVIMTATNTLDSSTKDVTLYFDQTPIPSGDVYADNGNLYVEIDDLNVEKGFGPEDDEWYPLDEIKAKINVENEGNDEIKNIVVQWGLYDADNDEWIVKGKFKLKDGDNEKLTVIFKIDNLNKIETDTNNFEFYAWATGEDEEFGYEKTSKYDSQKITMDFDDDFVVLDNIQIDESALCGGEVQITADVTNIGADDQEDIYVIIYNKELGINKKVTIGDIDSLESEKLDITLTLPSDVAEKQYDLKFSVYNDDGIYENDNDDKSEFFAPITLTSCSTTPSAAVSAVLDSDAKAGQELIVKATIVNTGSETKTFTLSTSGYANWASSPVIDKTSLTLDAGESQEVTIKLNVNKDISGDNNFNIEVIEGEKVLSQPVSVNIEKPSMFPNITGMFSGLAGDNWYLWGIGALNVLLVLVIIVVAVKVAKKKE